jgi:hypothetical protein
MRSKILHLDEFRIRVTEGQLKTFMHYFACYEKWPIVEYQKYQNYKTVFRDSDNLDYIDSIMQDFNQNHLLRTESHTVYGFIWNKMIYLSIYEQDKNKLLYLLYPICNATSQEVAEVIQKIGSV